MVPFEKGSDHLFHRMKETDTSFTTTEHLVSVIGREYVTNIIPGAKNSAGIMDSVCDFLSRKTEGVSMFERI